MKGRKSATRSGTAGASPRSAQNGNGNYASGGKVDCYAMGGVVKKKHLGMTSSALHGTSPMATAAVGQNKRPMKDGGVTEAGAITPPKGKKEKPQYDT